MAQQLKPSNKIRNKVINSFLLGLLMILSFGIVVFYLSTVSIQLLQNGAADQAAALHNLRLISRLSFLFLSLGSVIFMGLMFNIMFSVTPALKRIMFAVQEIGKGNFAYRLRLPIKNELGDIAATLNTALDKVQLSEEALRQEKASVEQLVQDRTNQLELEKAKFQASINGLPVGFMLADNTGRVLMMNPAMGRLLELQAATDQEFASNVENAGSLLRQLLEKSRQLDLSRQTQSSEFTTISGHYLHASYSPLSIDTNRLQGVVIVVEDVTEAKIIERSKDEFFSIASHELRTPLTAIRGNTELLAEFYKDMMQEERFGHTVNSIQNSAVRLIGIVNDFLDASRLEQGSVQLKLQPIAIDTVVATVIDEMQSIAQEKQVYVKASRDKLHELPLVYADPERVEQILYNLIGNALKFVQDGGVSVRAHVEGDHLKVLITDTGRGISPENQQLLFRKFQQANKGVAARDSAPGTGLGLYISKLLAEAMGGTVGLESSETDIGSTFSFTLPLADHAP